MRRSPEILKTDRYTKDIPEYRAWSNMLSRCRNETQSGHKNWAGRGITVCKRWERFSNFMVDMGPRPGKGYSLDRVNGNLGYFKKNCRWATQTQQSRNTSSNRKLSAFGRTQLMVEWCEEFKIGHSALARRLERGWTMEEALFIPIVKKLIGRGSRGFKYHEEN